MTSPSRNLPLLVPKSSNDPDIALWATVTQTSPALRIQLDGESQPLPFTPSTLESQLNVGDRVWVAFSTNASPSTKARRALIIGRSTTALSDPTLVMNLAHDPGATAFHNTAGRLGWRATRWFGTGTPAGTHTIVSVTSPDGGSCLAARKTWTTAPTGNSDTGFDCTYGWAATDTQGFSGIRPGYAYCLSGYLRTNATGGHQAYARIVWHDSGGVIIGSTINGPLVTLTANVWSRVSLVTVAPANAVYATCILDSNNGATWAVGNQLDGTWLMFTAGRTLWQYMDGGQPGGVWLGTANVSYSQGYTVAV